MTPDVLFHSLIHFEQTDGLTRKILHESGFTMEQVDSRLAESGSKFHESFARSPKEVLDHVERLLPDMLEHLPEPDDDGRIRLSVESDSIVGTDAIVDMTDLDNDEFQTLKTDVRNGCVIKKVRVSRSRVTRDIQMVLERAGDVYYLVTIYPGVKAPPIPQDGRSDSFWDRHCFIEYQK